MKFAVKALQEGAIDPARVDENRFCVRGLESKTTDGSQQRSQNKKLARKVVLDEQKRQAKTGKVDPSYISYLYKESTHLSLLMAQEIAMEDEEFVFRSQ